jgi:hypothetical protein
MTSATLSYPYRPKTSSMAFACVFFGSGALVMGNHAASNHRELILNGIFHFSVYGATVFYWCVAGLNGALAAIGMLKLLAALRSSGQLTLTHVDITAPALWLSRQATTARLADIKRLSVQVVRQQRFLNIYYNQRKLTISESFLPSRSAFEELCAAIAARVPASARAASSSPHRSSR